MKIHLILLLLVFTFCSCSSHKNRENIQVGDSLFVKLGYDKKPLEFNVFMKSRPIKNTDIDEMEIDEGQKNRLRHEIDNKDLSYMHPIGIGRPYSLDQFYKIKESFIGIVTGLDSTSDSKHDKGFFIKFKPNNKLKLEDSNVYGFDEKGNFDPDGVGMKHILIIDEIYCLPEEISTENTDSLFN